MSVDLTPRFHNPVPDLWRGWPRAGFDNFNGRLRAGHNPLYRVLCDPCGHKGVDLAADKGKPCLSAHPCEATVHFVVTPATNPLAGHGVELVEQVEGGWWGTRYLHFMAPTLLKPGDKVPPGSVVGLIGVSGNANYPHVHFETRWIDNLRSGSLVSQGCPADPMTLIRKGPEPMLWRDLKKGDVGVLVVALKGMMLTLGYGGRAGLLFRRFGRGLDEKIRIFQHDHGLTVDGIVGSATRSKLGEALEQALR